MVADTVSNEDNVTNAGKQTQDYSNDDSRCSASDNGKSMG